jgi:hypothetical protein
LLTRFKRKESDSLGINYWRVRQHCKTIILSRATELVVACRDGSKMLEFIEKALRFRSQQSAKSQALGTLRFSFGGITGVIPRWARVPNLRRTPCRQARRLGWRLQARTPRKSGRGPVPALASV